MIVSNRQVGILGGIAAALVVATIVVYSTHTTKKTDFEQGALLIQGLDVQQVAKIVLTEKAEGDDEDHTLTLARSQDGFAVAERHGYPASMKDVNDLIIKCLEIRCAQKVTENPENHEELGVAEDSQQATIVKFLDENDETLVGLVAGKSLPRDVGLYVRLLGEDTVYASEEGLYLSARPNNYIDTEILSVRTEEPTDPEEKGKKDVVEEVTVQLPDASYTIARDEGGKITLQDVPEGKQPKQSEVESVFGALSSLYFNDLEPLDSVEAEWDATYVCRTRKYMTYTVKLAKSGDEGDETHTLNITAQGASKALRDKHAQLTGQETEEEQKEKDAVFSSIDKAQEFNNKHARWAYEVSGWTAKKMRKPLDDLVEDIPEPEEPEEISARHILIAYKGAKQAGEDVSRSKDEAKELAEKVLEEAKKEGADFAELAKQHSDGPTAEKGGDLGSFKKEDMDKNFSQAAWKLEVGETSDVVETPFGFHIIQRTE
ncbi:MAG: peptidylprolyl isomerase [Candidatus Brocadiia bacterium]